MTIRDLLAHYEAVVDAPPVEAGGDPPTTPDVSPDLSVDGTPSPEATAPAGDPFDGFDVEELRSLTELAPVLRQILTPADPTPQGDAEPPQLDPFSETFGQDLAALIQQTVAPLVAPLLGDREQRAEQERTEVLKDALHDTEQRLGEFVGDEAAKKESRSRALDLAREILHTEIAPRYGMTNRAGELAFEKAHARVKQWEDSIGTAAVEKYKNELQTLGGATGEPSSNGGANGITTTAGGKFRDERDFTSDWLARNAT